MPLFCLLRLTYFYSYQRRIRLYAFVFPMPTLIADVRFCSRTPISCSSRRRDGQAKRTVTQSKESSYQENSKELTQVLAYNFHLRAYAHVTDVVMAGRVVLTRAGTRETGEPHGLSRAGKIRITVPDYSKCVSRDAPTAPSRTFPHFTVIRQEIYSYTRLYPRI